MADAARRADRCGAWACSGASDTPCWNPFCCAGDRCRPSTCFSFKCNWSGTTDPESGSAPSSQSPRHLCYPLPVLPMLQPPHKKNVSHVQRGDASEQGPLLGWNRTGQRSSGGAVRKKQAWGSWKGGEMKRKRCGSAEMESFVIACSLRRTASSSI